MKCVTDTNVVVSGLLWLGAPGRVLEAAARGHLTLLNYQNIPIVTPAEALRRLTAEQ